MVAYNLEFLDIIGVTEFGPAEEQAIEPLELGLDYYRTARENIYVFYWSPLKYRPLFSQYSYVLQIDTVSTFNSVNLREYNELNVLAYHNGQMVKGYEIEVFPREEGQTTFYWRVKPYISIKDGISIGESGLISDGSKYLFLSDVASLSETLNREVGKSISDSVSLSENITVTKV